MHEQIGTCCLNKINRQNFRQFQLKYPYITHKIKSLSQMSAIDGSIIIILQIQKNCNIMFF